MRYRVCSVLVLAVLQVLAASRKAKEPELSPLDKFISGATTPTAGLAPASTSGSLFSTGAPLLELSSDLRARRVNDIVTIVVLDRASAVAKGATTSARSSSAKSSITGLIGTPPGAGRLTNLLNLSGDQNLDGQGQTSRETTLDTTLTARVTQVLPNGLLVVEGFKSVKVNSEMQQIGIRGVVRPVDLSSDNKVASDSLAYLELTVNGKGVVGDAVRRPNILYRILLGILPF